MQKRLEDEGLDESSVLYSANVRSRQKVDDYYVASDFVAFGYGVDLLGNYHVSSGGGGADRPTKHWRFNPQECTYDLVGSDVPKAETNRAQNEEAKRISEAILEDRTAYDVVKDKKGARDMVAAGSLRM